MRKFWNTISRFTLEALFIASIALIVFSLVWPEMFTSKRPDDDVNYGAIYGQIEAGAKTLDSLRVEISKLDSARSKNQESITIINNKYETYRGIIASADNNQHIGIFADNINGLRSDQRDSVWGGYVGSDTNKLR